MAIDKSKTANPTAYEVLHHDLLLEFWALIESTDVVVGSTAVRRNCYASLLFAIVTCRDDADEALEAGETEMVPYFKLTSGLEVLLRKVAKTADEDALVKAAQRAFGGKRSRS